MLKKGTGYFQKAKYKLLIEHPGKPAREIPVESSLSGWYLGGNIVFGGLIGWVIVDPITGAMWTLPDEVNTTLDKEMSWFNKSDAELKMVLTQDIPKDVLGKIQPHMRTVN